MALHVWHHTIDNENVTKHFIYYSRWCWHKHLSLVMVWGGITIAINKEHLCITLLERVARSMCFTKENDTKDTWKNYYSRVKQKVKRISAVWSWFFFHSSKCSGLYSIKARMSSDETKSQTSLSSCSQVFPGISNQSCTNPNFIFLLWLSRWNQRTCCC